MRTLFLLLGLVGAIGATAITGFHGWHLGHSIETSATFTFFFSFVSLAAMTGPVLVSVVLRRARGWAKCWAILFAAGAAAAFAGNALNSLDAVVTRFDKTKAGRDTETDTRKSAREDLARLRDERAKMPTFAPAGGDAIEAAKAAVSAAETTRKEECKGRGTNCRDREADEREARVKLAKTISDAALTAQASRIDGDIEKLRRALGVAPAATTSDPWANAVARYFSIQEGDAATLRWFYLSVVVELSVALFLFAFELLGPGRKREERVAPKDEPAPIRISAPQPSPAAPAPPKMVTAPEGTTQAPRKQSDDTVGRFMLTCLPRSEGDEASWGDIYKRYLRYCEAEGIEAANPNEFGKRLDQMCKRVGIRTTKRDGKAFCINVRVAA